MGDLGRVVLFAVLALIFTIVGALRIRSDFERRWRLSTIASSVLSFAITVPIGVLQIGKGPPHRFGDPVERRRAASRPSTPR